MDHPILRSHAASDPNSTAEAQSQLRRPGETELDYYERRYQERVDSKKQKDSLDLMNNFLYFSNVFRVAYVLHRIPTMQMLN